MSIRILIADDHPIVREGLKRTLQTAGGDIVIVAEASNGKDVLIFSQKLTVDIYILDICMPELNGIETLVRLRRSRPESKVIFLSMLDNRSTVERAFLWGAKGYVLKENSATDIIQAIREVHRGRYFLSPAVAGFVVSAMTALNGEKNGSNGNGRPNEAAEKAAPGAFFPPSPQPAAYLTSREREVVQLIAEGYSSKEIAAKLALSLNTVRVHRRNIMVKLGAHSQADVTRFALKEGIAGASLSNTKNLSF